MAKNKDELPRRENTTERHKAQAAAARDERVKLDSFSVPDRFESRRAPGTGSYGHERD